MMDGDLCLSIGNQWDAFSLCQWMIFWPMIFNVQAQLLKQCDNLKFLRVLDLCLSMPRRGEYLYPLWPLSGRAHCRLLWSWPRSLYDADLIKLHLQAKLKTTFWLIQAFSYLSSILRSIWFQTYLKLSMNFNSSGFNLGQDAPAIPWAIQVSV